MALRPGLLRPRLVPVGKGGGPLDDQNLCCLQGIPKAPPRMSELEGRRDEEIEAQVGPGPAVRQAVS